MEICLRTSMGWVCNHDLLIQEGGVINYLVDGLVVRVLDQEVCFPCDLRFESRGC
jgi:hypothetical protein